MRHVLGFVSTLVLIGCSSGGGSVVGITQTVGSGGGQVVSADGDLTLDIPAGALPADTEITVRRIAPTGLGPNVAVAYELGPDGLVFQQPVTVTLRLDQSPVGPGGVLQADVVALFSRSGAATEQAGAQVLTGDADAGDVTVSGAITHFSTLFGVEGNLRVEVDGVPDAISADDSFDVTFDAVVIAGGDKPAATLRAWGDAPLAPGEATPFEESVVALGSNPVGMGPFHCTSAGDGTFHATAMVDALSLPGGTESDQVLGYTVKLSKPVVHQATARVLPIQLAALEAAALSTVPVPGLVPDGTRAVTVAGDSAWAVVDTDTGAELAHESTPNGPTFGAILLADNGVFAVLAFGEWGAALWYWNGSAFGAPVILSTNRVTDAVRIAGGGVIFSDNTAGQVRFLEFVVNAYVVSAIVMNLPGVISATQLADGSILAVTGGAGGALYAAASRDVSLLLVAQIADTLRRVRALGNVAVISYYGGGVAFGGISVAARSAGVWALVFGLIGTSSVGVDLKQPTSDFQTAVTNGHIFIAATSYLTNEYRVIEVDADGNYVADTLAALPAGCEAPGHALWLPDTNELAVTCHDSNTLVLIPVATG